MDTSLVIVAISLIGLGLWLAVVQFKSMIRAAKGDPIVGRIKLFGVGLGLILWGIILLTNGTW